MWKKLINIVIIIATAIILIMLLFFTSGTDELINLVYNMNYLWIAIAFCCNILYWIFDAAIIFVISKALEEKHRFKNSLTTAMIGQFFNAVTPFASGGQPMQIYSMSKYGMDAGHAASVMVVKSIGYQLTLFLYTLVVFIFSASFFIQRIPNFLTLCLFGVLVNLTVIFLYALFIYKEETANKLLDAIFFLLKKSRFYNKHGSFRVKLENFKNKLEVGLESFKEGTIILKGKTNLLFKTIILQIIQFTFLFIIPYFIYLAVNGDELYFFEILSSQALTNMITSFVPTPGSSGGAEGLGYMFFSIFFNIKIIIPVILMWRIITYYTNIIFGGLVSYFSNK